MLVEIELKNEKLVDDEIQVFTHKIDANIEFGISSALKWEEEFKGTKPEFDCDLEVYIDRIRNEISGVEEGKYTFSSVLAILRIVYCMIDSSQIKSFKEFAKMVNSANVENITNLISKVFEVIGKHSTKNF